MKFNLYMEKIEQSLKNAQDAGLVLDQNVKMAQWKWPLFVNVSINDFYFSNTGKN